MTSSLLGTGHFLDEEPDNGGDGEVTPIPKTLSGLVAWYDAATFDSTVIGNSVHGGGTVVESWPDSSGNGNNATKEDNPSRPEFLNKAIAEPSRIHFGETQWLVLPAAVRDLVDFTMFFVYKSDEPDPINTIVSAQTANGLHVNYWFTLQEEGRAQYQQGAFPLSAFTGDRRNSMRSFHVFAVRRDGNDVTMKNDTVSEGTSTRAAADTTPTQVGILGNTPGGSGHGVLMAEALFYNRALTNLEIQKIEAYLVDRYQTYLTVGSLNEMTSGIQAPGVMSYVDQRTIVDAVASERAFPMTIPDCLTWLDATRVPDFNQSPPADPVDEWASSVGAPGVEINGNSPAPENAPLIQYPSVGGKPAMDFTSADARMFFNSGLETAAGVTVFAVAGKWTPADPGSAFGSVIAGATKDDSGTNIPWLLGFTDAKKITWKQANGGSFVNLAGTTTLDETMMHIISARRSTQVTGGKEVIVRVDGVLEINAVPAVDPASTAGVEAWIGNASPSGTPTAFIYPLKGMIGEIIFYNRVLTDDEMFAVEEFLRRKWLTDIVVN